MTPPDDEYKSGSEIGKSLGKLFATPQSARENPRSPQGLKLVDQYASRFSDTSKQLGAGVAKTFTSPSDFFEPQKWQEAQSEASELAKQTPEFNAAKLRALQGGVGLPTYNKPDAPLRSELPAGTEPWAAQPSLGTAAPVLDVPVRQDDDTDYFVRQDILKTKAPDLAEFRKKPGFGTVSVKNQEGEYGEEKAPLEAETDWASEFIAKPTQFGTLSEPTLGEQVAMYPFALGAGLTEKAFETVGLDTPERAIPLSGGGLRGYETGRDGLEVLARFPEEFVGAATQRIAKGTQAFMDTPSTQEGVLGAVEDFSTATGNALEAMTDIPRKAFEWDADDYFEMSPEREAQIQAEDPERFQRLQASRQQAQEKAVAERLNPLSALPTIDVLSEDLRRVAEAFVMMPMEAVGALGDPSLTAEQRAARLGDMGAGLAFGGAGSMIKSIVSPAKAVKETPVEHLFNVFMLEGGLPSLFKPKAPVTMPREAGALRRDLEEMTGERDKVQGTAKVVSEEASRLQKAAQDLENLGFYQTPEALAAVDAKVVLAEAERRVAAAEEAVTRAQVGRQAVSDAVFEGATKAEADVPGAVNAGKRERVRLAEGARQKTDAEVKAEAKVTMAAAALREHTGGRPLGDWSATRREEFKARKSAEASAARPSTKNRRRGTPTLKAFERNEAAQGKFREFKPWMDEFKRLRGELKKASTEALKARESARKARQDDGRLAELSRAEEDARIAREAVRDSGKTAKGTLPKIGELKEIAKEARKEARLASARAAETEGFVQYPTAESRYIGKFELERKAQNQRVVNAGKDLAVAQEALRIARQKFDDAMLRDNERLRAVETKREGAVAGEPANLRARTAQGAQPSRVPGDDPLFFERQGLEAAREELRAASKAEKDALTDGGRVFVQGEGRPTRAAQGPDPARIEDAKKRRAVAEQTFAKAKSTFDAAAKAQKKSDAAAAAASRPPGIRDATKTRYALEQQLPKLKRDLEAAKAEEAEALKVLAAEQAGAVDAFGAAQRARQAALDEDSVGWFDDKPEAAAVPNAASGEPLISVATETAKVAESPGPDLALESAKKAVASAKTPEEASLAAAALERAKSRFEVLEESWLDDAEDLVDGTPEFTKEQAAYAKQQEATIDGFLAETQRKLDQARARNAASPSEKSASAVTKYESRLEELIRIRGEVAKAIEAGKKEPAAVVPNEATLNRAAQAKVETAPVPEPASASRATAEDIAKLRALRDAYQEARTARTTAEGVTRQFAQNELHPDMRRFVTNKDPAAAAADVAKAKAAEKAAKAEHDAFARSLGEPVIGAKPAPQPKDTRPKHVQEMEHLKDQYSRAKAWSEDTKAEAAFARGGDLAAAENLVRVAENQMANAKAAYDRLAKRHGLPKFDDAGAPAARPAVPAAVAPQMVKPQESVAPSIKGETAVVPDVFGAAKRARDAQHAEALERAWWNETLTPEQAKARPLYYESAAEWAQAAREAVAEAQAGVDGITDALRAAEQGVVAAKTAHLPPQFRQKLIDLQDEVVALTEQAKQAREFAKLADDPAMKNAQLVAERALAAKKAQLRQANAVVRRTEIQRQESFRRTDAKATALRNQFALRKRAQERIEARLRGDVTAAERRLVAATKDLANVADPLKNVVERNAKAAEALTEWSKTQEPVFQDLVRELNRLEDDFVRSESKQFWTEQLVRQVPKHLMTLGVSFVWEAAKRFVEKYLGQEGRGWVRQLAFSKGGRIPEEFVDFLENNSGRADLMKMGLETAKSQLPKEKWDLVSRWIDMQHLPEEGGYWSPGNFNFKAWEAPGHRAKYDPVSGRFKLTQEGEKHFGALVQEAMKHPEGSVERADLMAEVLRVNAEMDFMNERAMGLITQLKLVEAAAKKAELPRDPESLRPIWLPQILTPEAAKKAAKRGMGERAVAEQAKGRYEARADKFTDSRGGKPPMGRDPDAPMVRTDMKEYESSQLNRDRIPMSQRAELYNMETDLGRRVDAVGRLIHDIHRREVENFIASKYALTPEQFKAKRSLEAAQQEMRGAGDVRAVPKVDKAYKFVAEDAPWVPLAGKWIPEDIYYELANMENLSREAQQIVNRSMSKWKEWRTVGNPTTSNRNGIVSGLIFAPAAGVAPYMPKNMPLYSEVIADLMRPFNERDPLHIEMVERGKLGGSMMKTELMQDVGSEWMGAFQRGGVEPAKAFVKLAYEGPRAVWKVATNPKKALDERAAMKAWRKEYENPKLTPEQRLEVYKRKPKPGVLASAEKSADAAYEAGRTLLNAPGTIARDYYRFGDQIVKEVAYRKWRREGMSPEAASKKLDEHFPNYNTVPGIVHILKAPHSIVGPKGEPLKSLQLVNFVFSQPFAAYTATSFPIFMKWAKENPAQGAALMALHRAINNANLAANGLDEEKAKAIEKAMPAYRRTGEKLAARYTSNPRWAKTREGDWATVQTQFLHPLSETAITTDDTVSDTENAINVAKSLTGYGEHPFVSPMFALLGIDTTSPTAPPIYQPGDENVAERVTSHLMKKLGHPLAPSATGIMEGDLGYGPARGDPTKRIGGGTTTEGYALSQGAVPNRLGRYVSKDAFLSSQLGVKTGYTSEAESARQMSEQLKDRMVRTERDIVAGMSRQGLRINELKKPDRDVWLEAQRRIVERMMPAIDQTVKRLRPVKDDPVAFEYLRNYEKVLERWSDAQSFRNDRAGYEANMKDYDRVGWPRESFEAWAKANELAAMRRVYNALREATGAGTRETGEARRETRTGETE